MPTAPTSTLIALGTIMALAISGCSRDERRALTAAEEECTAAALVVEGLINSGGARDPALVADLVVLADVASPGVRGTVDELVSLAEVKKSSAELRTEWYGVLDDLDRVLLAQCDFSARALVADGADRGDAPLLEPATDVAAGVAAEDELEVGRPLDWEAVQSRVEAEWVERGYRGMVGLGPGIHVTVYGVESAPLAATVCADALESLTAEASATEVVVEVHGVDEGLLARTMDGVCTPR